MRAHLPRDSTSLVAGRVTCSLLLRVRRRPSLLRCQRRSPLTACCGALHLPLSLLSLSRTLSFQVAGALALRAARMRSHFLCFTYRPISFFIIHRAVWTLPFKSTIATNFAQRCAIYRNRCGTTRPAVAFLALLAVSVVVLAARAHHSSQLGRHAHWAIRPTGRRAHHRLPHVRAQPRREPREAAVRHPPLRRTAGKLVR